MRCRRPNRRAGTVTKSCECGSVSTQRSRFLSAQAQQRSQLRHVRCSPAVLAARVGAIMIHGDDCPRDHSSRA